MNTDTKQKNKRMKKQLVIDVGPTLVTIDAEHGSLKDTVLFTAYVNGISLRSNNMHLPTLRDRFIECVWLMAGTAPSPDRTTDMRAWINEVAAEGTAQ